MGKNEKEIIKRETNMLSFCISLVYFMLFDRLLKFLRKLYWYFQFEKYQNIILFFWNFVLFIKSFWVPQMYLRTYVLETAKWKHCKLIDHLMTSDIGVLSCVLTNKCYFLTWMDDCQPLLYTKFGDFRYIHVQSIEQITHVCHCLHLC